MDDHTEAFLYKHLMLIIGIILHCIYYLILCECFLICFFQWEVRHSNGIFYVNKIVHHLRSIFELLAIHANMKRNCLTFFTLLSFAVWFWAHKPIFSIALFILLAHYFTILIFTWSISWVSSGKFILAVTFYALNNIHHFSDSFSLNVFIFFITD